MLRTLILFLVLAGSMAPAWAETPKASAHDFSFASIEGRDLPLAQFAGKTVLIVNTASFCGFTHQYADLQAVWETYRDRGLVVLGVPSNDFGAQEPGNASEIKEFCEVNFAVDFPLADKAKVRGAGAHPFYRWARNELGDAASPKWNFHKYLVAPDGRLVAWFPSSANPTSSKVKASIERHLPQDPQPN